MEVFEILCVCSINAVANPYSQPVKNSIFTVVNFHNMFYAFFSQLDWAGTSWVQSHLLIDGELCFETFYWLSQLFIILLWFMNQFVIGVAQLQANFCQSSEGRNANFSKTKGFFKQKLQCKTEFGVKTRDLTAYNLLKK